MKFFFIILIPIFISCTDVKNTETNSNYCKVKLNEIRVAVDNLNYCEINSDCKEISFISCAVGCSVLVNSKVSEGEINGINAMIRSEYEKCKSARIICNCALPSEFEVIRCINSKCEAA